MKMKLIKYSLMLCVVAGLSLGKASAQAPLKDYGLNHEPTQSILQRMENVMRENVQLITPTVELHEESLEERLERYYEEFFDNLLSRAHDYIGTPYRSGGRTPKGFDCSGFTSYIFSRYGVKLSASSGSQINDGRRIARNEVKKGDLIFFKGRNSGSSRIGHVGIVSDSDDNGNIKFIHSASSGGVKVSSIKEPYYANRYAGSVRIDLKSTKL
jgi:hypothetical protein